MAIFKVEVTGPKETVEKVAEFAKQHGIKNVEVVKKGWLYIRPDPKRKKAMKALMAASDAAAKKSKSERSAA
jgi:ribosomal protein S11